MREQRITCDYPACGREIDPAQLVTVTASLPGADPVQLDLCRLHAPPLASAVGLTVSYPAAPAPGRGPAPPPATGP